ncbi:MAG: FHA protein [Gammaproteobacteria bacterium]|nr:FHA protein [Gammaproteobacteria bacterium]
MDVIIELISRTKRVIERHRYTGASITIGRAYDNDLIISDPHLSQHHAVLTDLGEDGWCLQDLNSKNGIFTRKHQRIQTRASVKSGDEIILGKTTLRIYDRFHEVPAALSMNPVEKIFQPLSRSGNAMLFILMAMAVLAMNSYLELYMDDEVRHIFADTMGLLLLGIGWALLWALIGRVMRHDARFLVQLVISVTYLLCAIFFENCLDVISFNNSSDTAAFIIGGIGHFLLFSTLLWLNLYIAISQTDRRRLLMANGISFSIVSLVLILYFINVSEFSGQPNYVHYLKPPALQWFSPVARATFLQQADDIFTYSNAQLDD